MIPIASIILYARLAALIITYGWKLVRWFKDRYDKVERESVATVMSSDDKANMFNRGAHNDIMHESGRSATKNEVNEIRESVWAAHNPGKQPRRLEDSKLRTRRASGKTAGRRST